MPTDPTGPPKPIEPGDPAEGWEVKAAASPFKEVNGTAELRGTQLLLSDSYIVNLSDKTTSIPAPTVASTQPIDLLSVNDGVPIFKAAPNAGVGTWTLAWGAEDDSLTYQQDKGVQLVVPISAQSKANAVYKSNITWTLTSKVLN